MLSQQTIGLIKSTAPLLQAKGEELTQHFYRRLFSCNPEVAPYFNRSNQSDGSQQRALAGAICSYAAHIDNLEALNGAVELIAQKHASLMIQPEHYPIIGENLLASIRDVLGTQATDKVIEAWHAAYNVLTKILSGREVQIYDGNAKQSGGWHGFRPFKIARKEVESSVITSFYLTPVDEKELPAFLPGKYITLRLPTRDGSTTMRNYSLSDQPNSQYFRISVKKERGKRGRTPEGYVSNKLHDEAKVGDILEVGPPCGDFYLDLNIPCQRPLVLLAAGVGITPILSILKTAAAHAPYREIFFVHGCLNEKVQAFKKVIDDLAEKHPQLNVHYRYSEAETAGKLRDGNCSTGFVDAAFIESFVPNLRADYYFCGPKPFMANIYQKLLKWEIPEDWIHFEFFGPKQELERV